MYIQNISDTDSIISNKYGKTPRKTIIRNKNKRSKCPVIIAGTFACIYYLCSSIEMYVFTLSSSLDKTS